MAITTKIMGIAMAMISMVTRVDTPSELQAHQAQWVVTVEPVRTITGSRFNSHARSVTFLWHTTLMTCP